ncbi:MAG: ubiquinol-cytochrome c reductase iron-sulfur subunit [Pirellulales bacterium]|jgi:cytochrome b6-f complex iron-sulfur subunit
MAEKKKMSVADILAAARADKQSAPDSEKSPAKPKVESADLSAAESSGGETTPKSTGSSERPSVADILAMARSGKGKPAEEPKKSAPAAKQPAAKKAVSAKKPVVSGAKKNVQRDTASILEAARAGTKPGPVSKSEAPGFSKPTVKPAVKKAAKAPPRPVPPRPVRQKTEKAAKAMASEDRRGFLAYTVGSFMAIGFTALSATGGLFSLGLARFLFPNVLAEPPSRFKVGSKEGFPSGVVETKFVAQYGVWVVNGDFEGVQQIYALKTVCTHLGCTPNWLEAEQKFKCPCHGSGFYKDGINFEGPAPRPLERYAIRIADDGQLEVDKSKSFQEELGQWNDPESYVTG